MESRRQRSGCFWKSAAIASRNMRFSTTRKSFVGFVSRVEFVALIKDRKTASEIALQQSYGPYCDNAERSIHGMSTACQECVQARDGELTEAIYESVDEAG